jgi:YggT family protein
MRTILITCDYILQLYFWVIIAGVIMSWLLAFNIINGHNPTVRTIWQVLTALTEPFLRPIRAVVGKVLPNLRGIDISPIFLIIAIFFLQTLIRENLLPLFPRYSL